MAGPPQALSKKTLAQVFVHLGPGGLGGMLFGNINATLPSIGAAEAIHLGRF